MKNRKAKVLLEALDMAPNGLIVEIGSVRQENEVEEDGFSTVYLASYANDNNLDFHSYDNEQPTVDLANMVLQRNGLNQLVECRDGVEALKSLGPISFLYLDSHKNPQFSLDQYRAANLAPGAIVCIDDTHSYEGWEFGKATYLIDLAERSSLPFDIVDTFESYYKTAMTIIQIPESKVSGSL